MWLRPLLAAVELDPLLRWRDGNLREQGLDPVRVRRWFLREHGMTFHSYLRARRLGAALGRLQHGDDMTTVAYDHGYDSVSGFRDAFKQVFGDAPGTAFSPAISARLCWVRFCSSRFRFKRRPISFKIALSLSP